MRLFLLGFVSLLFASFLSAQRACRSFEYQQRLLKSDPSLQAKRKYAEDFARQFETARTSSGEANKIITIPVIIHILYHYPYENLPDNVVKSQLDALNRDFRKFNSDTFKIPAPFKLLAADCGIEFKLATVDINGTATTGIIRKYTPVTKWTPDDKIKISAETGDDAWDAKSYLNIWVGTLDGTIGYSSSPGDPAEKDGLVISNTAFGITNSGIYGQGRTTVHELGHWLGLRHLWGDADCGDDGVADTPRQQTFTNGCPSTVRISCNNAPFGDMYMDYMDFTNDDCLVMFTEGQKQKMRTLFEAGGPRYSIFLSKGLSTPSNEQIPLPDASPQWLHVKIYPDPVSTELTVNMDFDPRWVGKQLRVFNVSGQEVMRKTINSKTQKLNISQLKPGIYFIMAEKDGEKIREKFVKF